MNEENLSSAGVVYDDIGVLLGRYLYLKQGQQDVLDAFLEKFIAKSQADPYFMWVIDIETDGLNEKGGQILLVSISWNGRQALVFQPRFFNLDLFRRALEIIPLGNQRLQFDARWFYHHLGVMPNVKFCTQVMAQVGYAGAFPSPYGDYGHAGFDLANLAFRLLPRLRIDKTIRSEFVGWDESQRVLRDDHIAYSAGDVLLAYRLIPRLLSRLVETQQLHVWEQIEQPLMPLIVEMEHHGLPVDVEEVKRMSQEYQTQYETLTEEIRKDLLESGDEVLVEMAPKFNPNSGPQLLRYLHRIGFENVMNTKADTMEILLPKANNPTLFKIREAREAKSILTKFPKAWLDRHIDPETRRIYPTFNQCGAATGRLSGSDPNPMNIPASFRHVITADEGFSILTQDYSQFEFRGLAAETSEPYLLDAFTTRAQMLREYCAVAKTYELDGVAFDDPDDFAKAVVGDKVSVPPDVYKSSLEFLRTDIHRRTASLIFKVDPADILPKQRKISKTLGYAILYGAEIQRILVSLAIEGVLMSESEASELKDKFNKALPMVHDFVLTTHAEAIDLGQSRTILGRKRFYHVPPRWAGREYHLAVAAIHRESVNARLQGGNGDATKLSMGYYRRHTQETWAPGAWRLINVVHDELVSMIRDDHIPRIPELDDLMVEAGCVATGHRVPIEVAHRIQRCWAK